MTFPASEWLVLTRNFVAGSHPQNDRVSVQPPARARIVKRLRIVRRQQHHARENLQHYELFHFHNSIVFG